MPGGRPTKYDPKYCEELIEHMNEGYSFESFAGRIGVTRSTIYEWAKVNEQFSDAKSIAVAKSLMKWEGLGLSLANGDAKGSAPAWIFSMKNRFPDLYSDKREIETTTKPDRIPHDTEDDELY